MTYSYEKAFSEKMMPYMNLMWGEIPNKHTGGVLFKASDHQDLKEATDVIMHSSGGAIGFRVRRFGCENKVGPIGFDWSVRWYSNGYPTEIDKLRSSNKLWRYFIAVANENQDGLEDACLIDMEAVRLCGILRPDYKPKYGDELAKWDVNENKDGTTAGGYFPCQELYRLGCVLWYPEISRVEVPPRYPPGDEEIVDPVAVSARPGKPVQLDFGLQHNNYAES